MLVLGRTRRFPKTPGGKTPRQSSTPILIGNRYIMYRTSTAFPAVAITPGRRVKASPCGVSKTDEMGALPNVFLAISQRPSHIPPPQLTRSLESTPDTPMHTSEQTRLPVRT